MTQETDFFDGVGGGSGAPSAQLSNEGDVVQGEIVDMYKRDYIAYGQKEPEKRDDGTNKQQLVIILQTANRNWAGCTKVPDVDPSDPSKGQKTPDQDDGKRAIYVPEGKNIQFAIGRAATEAKVRLAVGGNLAVKVSGLRDTGKGNPLKEHVARYVPPTAGGDFFAGAPAAPAQASMPQAPLAQGSSFGGGDRGMNAPAQPAPQAPAAPAPSQDPWATPAAPAAPAAPSQDPWATPAAPTSNPPF